MAKKRMRFLNMLLVCCFLATSCQKTEESAVDKVKESSLAAAAEEMSPTFGSTTNANDLLRENYEKEFARFVVSSNMTVRDTEFGINKLCNEIDRNADVKEAMLLFDKLGEMAINQYVSETNYYCRQNWYLQLWHVTLDAFCFAQNHRRESFEDWDRLFRFFKRYTDEISEIENNFPPPDQFGSRWSTKKGLYLQGIKADLKEEVHVMRRFYFPKLSEGLTEEQRKDILRRFEEVEKYTALQPDAPRYKK